MNFDELNHHYQRLRAELHAAYTASVWDSRNLDRIADELVPLELALANIRAKSAGLPETTRAVDSYSAM